MNAFVAAIRIGLAMSLLGACQPREARPLVNFTPQDLSLSGHGTSALKAEVERHIRRAQTHHRLYRGTKNVWYMDSWSEIRIIDAERVVINYRVAAYDGVAQGGSGDIYRYEFHFEELADLTYDATTCTDKSAPLPRNMRIDFQFAIGPEVCNALYSLGQHYKQERDEADAAFAAQLARRGAQTANSALPESLRRIIVQAEAARQRREYGQAANLFLAALRQDAVAYPAGWFNLALLYEQQERYARAIDSMRKYLALQPNAADARAAQDKIYEWEALVEGK